MQCAVTEPQKPVREGYTFGGWYKDAECTDIRKFNFDTQSQLMTDITLFAKWIPNSYRVYYNLSLPDGSVYESEDMYKSYDRTGADYAGSITGRICVLWMV